eukprot:PhM_4_TR11644/c3_g1_i5/m.68064
MMRRYLRFGQPQAASNFGGEDMMTAIRSAKDLQLQVFMALMWACASRPGEILQLERDHLTFHDSKDGHTIISMLFTQGKVLKKIDPYTIHTTLPDEWAQKVRRLVQLRKEDKFLFPTAVNNNKGRGELIEQARCTLRTIKEIYDVRAVRRGAARQLAKAGVPLKAIMLFTRHSNVEMLRRYLGFGQAQSEEATRATSAALELWPRRC